MGYARVGSNPAVVASHFWRDRAPGSKRDRIPRVFGVACALLAEWSKALRSGRSLQSEAQVRILRSAVALLAYDRPHGSVGRALGC
jgi:hypothetical protein